MCLQQPENIGRMPVLTGTVWRLDKKNSSFWQKTKKNACQVGGKSVQAFLL
jgi:hypothetical protein